MKLLKFIVPILVLGLFTSCEDRVKTMEEKADDYIIKVIDGCEYIMIQHKPVGYGGYGFMAHKGNCKNEYHKTIK